MSKPLSEIGHAPSSTAHDPSVVLPEINFGIDPLPDLYDHIARLRADDVRVAPVNYIGGIAWLVIDYDDVSRAYANEAEMPAAPAYRRHSVPSQGVTLLAMEGEKHRINRALVSSSFQPGAIRRLIEPVLVPLANRLIDRLAAKTETDLIADYARPYPFAVISAMVGIPEADQARFMEKVLLLFRYPWEPERAVAARDAITSYLQPIIAGRRKSPQQDVISLLASAELEGETLSDEEICSFIRLLYPAGAETTYLTMGSMLWEILSSPDLYARLMADPDLRTIAVEEALRKHGATTLQPRYTENEIVIAGVTIPADSWVLFGNGPANHDPTAFPDPEEFRLDRGPIRHITFGRGPHFCLGSHLAREELRLSLDLLLDRLSGLKLQPDCEGPTGAVLRGTFHLPVSYDAVLPPPG